MKTTNLGNVAVQDIGVSRSNIPINRNVFTSCGFGEVQPLQVLQVDADTETTFSVEDLTFVEPIVAPVYGHCSVKYWHYFCAFRDLFDDFDSLLAETKVRKVGGLFVPKKVPHAPRNLISTLLLWGAKCTIYRYSVNAQGNKDYLVRRPTTLTELASYCNAFASLLGNISTAYRPSYSDSSVKMFSSVGSDATGFFIDPVNYLGLDTGWIDARMLVDFDDTMSADFRYELGTMKIPLANRSIASFFDMSALPEWTNYGGLDPNMVPIGKHDFLIERPDKDSDGNPTSSGTAFVFRMSAFGKRMLKVFKGVEFQESWTDSTVQSLIPFFAVYKVYFDCFGLLQWDNFESTPCKRLLNHYEQWCGHRLGGDFSIGFFDSGVPNSEGNSWIPYQVFQEFIKDLGSLWVTDSQDVQSAHMIAPNIARNDTRDSLYTYLKYGFFGEGGASTTAVQVPNVPNSMFNQDGSVSPENYNGSSQQPYIDRVEHSHLDSELLKTMYLCTNLQTIAGQRVKELLQMLGFGDWMEHQKPRFIGYDEQSIEFNQVQAKADTLKDGTGMALGERAGVGESYKFHKQHKFTNNETGFVISLMAVVPDSGYVNTMNVAFGCIEKYDFFQAAFDGKGMELNKIGNVIVGSEPNAVSDPTQHKPLCITKESFGYAPTATRFKFVNNIFNGKFAQQSVMDNYTPYSMDKVIKLGEIGVIKQVNETINSTKYSRFETNLVFDPMKTPRAGLVWRYPTRYPWFGQLTRIFAAIGDFVNDGDKIGVFNMLMNGYEYFNLESDGFVMLQTIRGQEWTHKLPISDSFETREDGNSGPISKNVSKA